MTELINKGYLYIAQPPLFKIGKGKNEDYFKNEQELNDFLLKRICEKRLLRVGTEGVELTGHRLYIFVGHLSEQYAARYRMERKGIYPEMIDILMEENVRDKSFLRNIDQMRNLKRRFEKDGFEVGDILWNEDRDIYELMVGIKGNEKKDDIIIDKDHMEERVVKVGRGLIYSKDYQIMCDISKKIEKYDQKPFVVENIKDKKTETTSEDKKGLLKYLIEEGKKGISLQRYKGLGEMNPEQLWETTMNPNNRTLLKVKVEDAVDSDDIFTILMGEDVEPRREFIQTNALEVESLDI
jgi:DNA gyrase subunit B